MANVKFKRGQQKDLFSFVNNEITIKNGVTVDDGTFYLTTDTDRLFIGKQDGNKTKLVELNKSITVVDTFAELELLTEANTDVGQFYYIKGGAGEDLENVQNGNILAVCTGFKTTTDNGGNRLAKFVQVNPDTNDNTDTGYDRLTSFTASDGVSDTEADTITYTLTLRGYHTGVDGSAGTSTIPDFPLTCDLVIKGEDLVSIITDTSVGLETTNTGAPNKSVFIKTKGAGSDSSANSQLTLTGGTNTTVSASGQVITINADDTSYVFASPAGEAKIQYTQKVNGEGSGVTDMATFTAGNGLTVSGATAGQIQYSHGPAPTTGGTSVTANTPSSTATASDGAQITLVSGVKKDSFGHIVSVDTTTVTAKDTTYTVNSVGANNTGDLSVEIKASSGGTSSKTASGALYHKITVDGTENTVYNQNSLGSFYSADEIDKKLRNLDALTYKGTIGNSPATVQSLPLHPSNGDTYKVATAGGPYGGNMCEVGDLLIATGDEYQDTDSTKTATYVAPNAADHDTKIGTIVSPTWTLVSSGADADTTYSFSVNNNSIIAIADPGGNSTVATIAGGNKLTASTSGSTITISHDPITPALSTANEFGTNTIGLSDTQRSFKVPKFTVDAYGHVTSVGEETLTLPQDKDTTYNVSAGTVGTSGNTKSAVILAVDGSSSGFTSVPIIGDTNAINVEVVGTDIKVSHRSDLLKTGTAGTVYGKTGTQNTVTTAAGGSIKVPQITVNAQGHVTAVGEQTITLPPDSDTKFQLRPTTIANPTASNGVTTATMIIHMSDTSNASSNATTSNVILRSSSLSLTTSGSGNTAGVTADIVWGSFN